MKTFLRKWKAMMGQLTMRLLLVNLSTFLPLHWISCCEAAATQLQSILCNPFESQPFLKDHKLFFNATHEVKKRHMRKKFLENKGSFNADELDHWSKSLVLVVLGRGVNQNSHFPYKHLINHKFFGIFFPAPSLKPNSILK